MEMQSRRMHRAMPAHRSCVGVVNVKSWDSRAHRRPLARSTQRPGVIGCPLDTASTHSGPQQTVGEGTPESRRLNGQPCLVTFDRHGQHAGTQTCTRTHMHVHAYIHEHSQAHLLQSDRAGTISVPYQDHEPIRPPSVRLSKAEHQLYCRRNVLRNPCREP
jgi:hypothetical protein